MTWDTAAAQSDAPPSAEALATTVKDQKQYQRVFFAVDALRSVLNLILLKENIVSKEPGQDFPNYQTLRRTLNDSNIYGKLLSEVYTREVIDLIVSAGKTAQPTAAKIESTLRASGVDPKGLVGTEMITGFYKISQLKAVVDRKVVSVKESWYCSVFPFSWFCTVG